MTDYKEMYLTLFRAMSKALEQINKCDIPAAKQTIMTAQQKTEEMYIER